MNNDTLKQLLKQKYAEDPFAYGSIALKAALREVDVTSFTKKDMDTVFAFIDTPQKGGDFDEKNLLKNEVINSLYCDQNLIFLNLHLPELKELDPIRYRENTKKVATFTNSIDDKKWDVFLLKWEKGDTADKKRVLRKVVNILNAETCLETKVRLAHLKNVFGVFDTGKNIVFLNVRPDVLKIQGLNGCVRSFVHEINHADMWHKTKEVPFNRLYFSYFVSPYFSLKAYKRNYIELDARDAEKKMLAALYEKQNDGR